MTTTGNKSGKIRNVSGTVPNRHTQKVLFFFFLFREIIFSVREEFWGKISVANFGDFSCCILHSKCHPKKGLFIGEWNEIWRDQASHLLTTFVNPEAADSLTLLSLMLFSCVNRRLSSYGRESYNIKGLAQLTETWMFFLACVKFQLKLVYSIVPCSQRSLESVFLPWTSLSLCFVVFQDERGRRRSEAKFN